MFGVMFRINLISVHDFSDLKKMGNVFAFGIRVDLLCKSRCIVKLC